jgi:hypothetical protein
MDATNCRMERKLCYGVILIFFITVTTCNSNKNPQISKEDVAVKTITIHSSDIRDEEIGDFLVLDSYIILSNNELFGEIKRIMMDDNRIYICDATKKIFCFDMSGSLVYVINQQGQGPQEYINIADFGVGRNSEKLYIYDDYSRRMLIFNKDTGKYLSEFSTKFMLPLNFGIIDDAFYFNNDDDRRVVDKETQQFFLLYSKTGKEIDCCFFPHDASAEYHFGSDNGHPFFYNNEKLLYNKWLDCRVYFLEKDCIVPLYDIILPNQLPKKKIEEKMEHWNVVLSDYAYGVDNIFVCDSILHFTFSKDRLLVSCFYDLETDKLLFCGAKGLAQAREKLPFDWLIKGVCRDKFFALVPPDRIIELRKSRPELFPEDLKTIQQEDNCIIAFYKIMR